MVFKLSWRHHFPVAGVEFNSPAKVLGILSVTSRLQRLIPIYGKNACWTPLLGFNIQDFFFPHSAPSDHTDQHLETRKGVTYLDSSGASGARAALSLHLATVSPSPAILKTARALCGRQCPCMWPALALAPKRGLLACTNKVVSLSICTAHQL